MKKKFKLTNKQILSGILSLAIFAGGIAAGEAITAHKERCYPKYGFSAEENAIYTSGSHGYYITLWGNSDISGKKVANKIHRKTAGHNYSDADNAVYVFDAAGKNNILFVSESGNPVYIDINGTLEKTSSEGKYYCSTFSDTSVRERVLIDPLSVNQLAEDYKFVYKDKERIDSITNHEQSSPCYVATRV